MNKMMELYRKLDKAERAYLELRDAKSNGCCAGMSIVGVLMYDAKIEAAWEECRKINQEITVELVRRKENAED